ncbi:hypothetical protein [Candidatus Bathycorpusculum sp.]|uniref:hypothetical protein n=1 Tax=Candidatus Bathycorpusculum sp. TaxID=2994959 RepID=UPI0028313DDA|nr:hypothetical protein [Candidatus Termitimicrobium sp.]MCL2431453.1 hypothetical protein [Candidatus Termitimicrobium sp.]
MDLSNIKSGGSPKQAQSAMEYVAQAASPLINGEVKLTISDNALIAIALFDAIEITFAEINTLDLTNYIVTVKADSGDYTFSHMGNWCQPFYDTLCDAYNKAVLRSLFIKNNPILTAKGEYRYNENGENKNTSAVPIYIYENNVTALPPNLSARRVPLCFITAIERGDYELTLRLDTGETYTYAKIGYDTAIFTDTVEKQLRKLREESLIAIKGIDPALTAAQASQIAKIMPPGVAVPIGKLAEIAPSFREALENKIATSRANKSYIILKELCDPTQIFVGFRKNETLQDIDGLSDAIFESASSIPLGSTGGSNTFETSNGLTDANNETKETKTASSDPYLIWLIAPSPDGQFATVEFAEADSATFVYHTGGNFTTFARQINRALEAINFKREVIRMTDKELQKPENADYYMAAKRTTALQFVRSNFVGRIIHSNMENWKQKLTELWNSTDYNG